MAEPVKAGLARHFGHTLTRGHGAIDPLPLVGLAEVARMFGVSRNTAQGWRRPTVGVLPPAELILSGSPLWRVPTIVSLASRTGRSVVWHPWAEVEPTPLKSVEDVRGESMSTAGLPVLEEFVSTAAVPPRITSVQIESDEPATKIFYTRRNEDA